MVGLAGTQFRMSEHGVWAEIAVSYCISKISCNSLNKGIYLIFCMVACSRDSYIRNQPGRT